MSRLQPPKDLAILRRIAAGAVVERAKRGELSDAEERQLLGLSEEEYRALRTAPAPSMAGQPPQHGMPQPGGGPAPEPPHAHRLPVHRTAYQEAVGEDSGLNWGWTK